MTDEDRYLAAAHAVQSGVATEMTLPHRQSATEPKHLRVGINAAMCDHAALVKLLIDKGVITSAEYTRAVADAMEDEKKRYENRLTEYFGKKIILG